MPPAKKQSRLIRKEIYTVEEVLSDISAMPEEPYFRCFDGDLINMGSLRYHVFKTKGCACIQCGLAGTFFAKERHPYPPHSTTYHFNLYGIDAEGDEVMLTKDHVLPRARGGSNTLDNLQPMCTVCNALKGSALPPAH